MSCCQYFQLPQNLKVTNSRVQQLRQTQVQSIRSNTRFKRIIKNCNGSNQGEGQKSEDVVEKVFGMVFGKTALEEQEPMGMKRMSDEALNEQYPATTTEFADPLDSDSVEMALFRPLLAKTQLEKKELRLCYDADVDGWSAEAFHSKLNSYGAAVILAKTQGGAVIGGYNPKGWIGLGEDRNSMAAFLFTWTDGDTSKPAIKLPKVGGAGLAVIDKDEFGPLFGPDGLRIPLTPPNEKSCKSKLGSYYARRPDGGKTLFSENDSRKSTDLVELKAFVAAGDPVQWELDGIVWKTQTSD